MWADTLLAWERTNLVRLGVWGGASAVLGAVTLLLLVRRRARAPLLRHFALQTGIWGVVELVFVALRWHGLAIRDFTGAQRLALVLRLAVGAEVGALLIGATLATAGWVITRRQSVVGAGAAIILQGAALLMLDASLLRRMVGGG